MVLTASSFLPRAGGVEEHVRHLALELRDRGHRVAVWAVDQGDAPASLPGVTVRYMPAPLPAARPVAAARFLADAPAALRAWERAWALDRPDVVHVHCFGPNGPWSAAMAARHRTSLVIGAHGETFMDEHAIFDASVLLRTSLRWALHRADAVTACSQYAADDLVRFGLRPGSATVVHNGVDAHEPGGEVPPWLPDRYLLAVGRLVPVKGFDLLLRAFAAAGLDPRTRLVIAGDGPERPVLQALAADLGVADRVILPGRLQRPEVVTVMARARALVVPSRIEAFGIVVLEGMRAGRPVVAPLRGGAGEIVTDGHDGVLVDPTDTGSLAALLARLDADPVLRARLGVAAARTAARFTWGEVADRVERLYRALPKSGESAPARPAPAAARS